MMFTQQAKEHVTACRICFMCRHLCPVGLVTGKESHTPRGRSILVQYSIGAENGAEIFQESVPSLYECCLCNACASWCETGYEPGVFIREARREAIAADVLPGNIRPVVERALESGGLFPGEKRLPAEAGSLSETADILLVLGETALAKAPHIAKAAVSLMKKANLNFTVLRDEPPAGAMLYDLAGEIGEVESAAERFTKAAKSTGCSTIVVLDPADARVLLADYPRWGQNLGAEVVTVTAFVAKLLADGKLRVKRRMDQRPVTYHDPCRLARDLEETEPAREILAAMGANLSEIFLNKENTRCCGGECLAAHSPAIAIQTAKARIDQAAVTGAETLVTACPGCNDRFQAARADGDMAVEDLLVLLDGCC